MACVVAFEDGVLMLRHMHKHTMQQMSVRNVFFLAPFLSENRASPRGNHDFLVWKWVQKGVPNGSVFELLQKNKSTLLKNNKQNTHTYIHMAVHVAICADDLAKWAILGVWGVILVIFGVPVCFGTGSTRACYWVLKLELRASDLGLRLGSKHKIGYLGLTWKPGQRLDLYDWGSSFKIWAPNLDRHAPQTRSLKSWNNSIRSQTQSPHPTYQAIGAHSDSWSLNPSSEVVP